MNVQVVPFDRIVHLIEEPLIPHVQHRCLEPHHLRVFLRWSIVERGRIHRGNISEPVSDMLVPRDPPTLQELVDLDHSLLVLLVLLSDIEELRQEASAVSTDLEDVLLELSEFDLELLLVRHKMELGAQYVNDDCIP